MQEIIQWQRIYRYEKKAEKAEVWPIVKLKPWNEYTGNKLEEKKYKEERAIQYKSAQTAIKAQRM